jgi:hypothetical protein
VTVRFAVALADALFRPAQNPNARGDCCVLSTQAL